MRYLLVLFFCFGVFAADIIPSTNNISWSTIGIGAPGGPIFRNSVIRNVVTDGGADNTGATDCSAAIQGQIDLCSSNDVVYFPAGRYKLTSIITTGTRSITLRGAGMTNTTIIDGITPGTPTGLIAVGLNNPGADISISTANRDDSTITVSDATGFAVGQMCVISQTNEPGFVWHVSGTERMLRQTCKITSVAGTTIGIDPPLFWTFNLQPKVHLLPSVAYAVGFENMTITHTNTTTGVAGTSGSSIFFDQAYGCWITNVESSWAKNRHFYHLDTMRSTISHNFIHDAQGHGPDQGVGIEGAENFCVSLIEDNILTGGFPHIMLSTASSGNVIIYNFSDNVQSGSIPSVGGDMNNNHGPHTMFNVWEGNIGSQFQSDGYFGSSSHATLFRNYWRGIESDPTYYENIKCVDLDRYTYYYNVVGNVLGHPSISPASWTYTTTVNAFAYSVNLIYRFGYPNMGNNGYSGTFPADATALDTNVITRTLLEGNYDYKNLAQVWSGSPATLVDSYYYSSKPNNFGSLSWPPINPASPSTNLTVIPAGYRYINGIDPSNTSSGTAQLKPNSRLTGNTRLRQ